MVGMKLPRFQFRLRTLMIGVTLLAVLCGYVMRDAKTVAARKAWYESHPRRFLRIFPSSAQYTTLYPGDPLSSPSLLRRWLSDRPQLSIVVSSQIAASQLSKRHALFPESAVAASPEVPSHLQEVYRE
jgi:hypothetical protein